jgi:hypothetical protein
MRQRVILASSISPIVSGKRELQALTHQSILDEGGENSPRVCSNERDGNSPEKDGARALDCGDAEDARAVDGGVGAG